jgi:hypothetical protein
MRPSVSHDIQPSERVYAGLDFFLAVTSRASHLNALRRASAQQRSLLEDRVTVRGQGLYPIVLSEPLTCRK